MRPQRIILIRHGQSMANVDRTLHSNTPDHKIPLTEKGKEQAYQAGIELFEELHEPFSEFAIQFYISPYLRTRETYQGILLGLRSEGIDTARIVTYEDPRLREQEFGNFRSVDDYAAIEIERDNFGTFYYRLSDGESGADVFDRVTGAMDTMHRDFEKEAFPRNVVIVSHGLTIRLFLMRWFHWTVEEFEAVRNPHNCQYYVLDKLDSGKYQLLTDIDKYTESETRAYLTRRKYGSVDIAFKPDP